MDPTERIDPPQVPTGDADPRTSSVRALVVYESMYGNTHRIATAIGEGLEEGGLPNAVVPVGHGDGPELDDIELLVVGGPTHIHGMSRSRTREAAREAAESHPWQTLDDDADDTGLRDWLSAADELDLDAAAFDTRLHRSPLITGRASKGIARLLRRSGARIVSDPASFMVTSRDELEPGEEERAHRWGVDLAATRRPWGRVVRVPAGGEPEVVVPARPDVHDPNDAHDPNGAHSPNG
jgi:hypothetical protein